MTALLRAKLSWRLDGAASHAPHRAPFSRARTAGNFALRRCYLCLKTTITTQSAATTATATPRTVTHSITSGRIILRVQDHHSRSMTEIGALLEDASEILVDPLLVSFPDALEIVRARRKGTGSAHHAELLAEDRIFLIDLLDPLALCLGPQGWPIDDRVNDRHSHRRSKGGNYDLERKRRFP